MNYFPTKKTKSIKAQTGNKRYYQEALGILLHLKTRRMTRRVSALRMGTQYLT